MDHLDKIRCVRDATMQQRWCNVAPSSGFKGFIHYIAYYLFNSNIKSMIFISKKTHLNVVTLLQKNHRI